MYIIKISIMEGENVRKAYMTVDDVSMVLGVSKPFAYQIIRELNGELHKKGFIVISGKIPTKLLEEKYYGLEIK